MIQYLKPILLSVLFLIIGVFVGGGSILREEGLCLKDRAIGVPVSDSLAWSSAVIGSIQGIDNDVLMVNTKNGSLNIRTTENTRVEKAFLSNEEKEMNGLIDMGESLALSDLRQGNRVILNIASKEGNLLADRIYVLSTQ